MSWREEAQRLFPSVSLDNVPRASVPTVPASSAEVELGTPDTLARVTLSAYDAHVSDWTDRQERAAIMEYDGGLTLIEAEQAAGDHLPVLDGKRAGDAEKALNPALVANSLRNDILQRFPLPK